MKIQRPESKQPLPPHAKRVFIGEMFGVYQWEVEDYNGKKRIFEKIKRADTVVVIPIMENGKIVLAKQEQPNKGQFIGAIDGRLEEGEQPLEGAKRELLEETGLEAKEWILLNAVQPAGKVEWAVYTFVAKGCKKVAKQNLDGAEKVEPMFVDYDQFVGIVTHNAFGDQELRIKFLEAKLEPQKLEEYRKFFS